jgi:hypothetical protein
MDLQKAVTENPDNFISIYTTKAITIKSPLMNFFIFDNAPYPTFEFMHSPGNFFVPKLGLPFALLFAKSYLCMAMAFSFFAFGGLIRLYKFFVHYFPAYSREVALATLFLPSLCFWSSGFLKDGICLGCVGYLVYAMFNIFIKRKRILASVIWIAVSVILLFFIKVYILLALSPAIVLWLFSEFNKIVENKTLRRIMTIITFIAGAGFAFFLINYVTSDESVQEFKLDTLVDTSNRNRALYEGFAEKYEGAYYTIGSSNPVLIVLNGIIATLFRPFLWDITSPIVLLSALEALFFTYFTFFLIFKRGLFNFFRKAFGNPIFIMCIVFTLVFAAAVGSTATNFGSLSRYKIPCLPFFLIVLLIIYRQEGFSYPNWINKLLGYNLIHRHYRKTKTAV